jgi:hypothetical protein
VIVWLAVLCIAAVSTLLAVLDPLVGLAFGTVLGLGLLLFRRYGLRMGAWYLILITLPIREPLSVDVIGTKTLYFGDLLLYLLGGVILWENGIRRVWSRSPAMRIGLAILVISAVGLYASPRPLWAVAAIQRIVGQILVLYLARTLIRSSDRAVTSLLLFLVGMIPAIVYGFFQAAIPVAAHNYPDWSDVPFAYDAAGTPLIRIFSTYDHPLHFSQALSMALGLAIGLFPLLRRPSMRLFLLVVGAASVMCNLFTYSVSGIVGAIAAVGTALFIERPRALVLVPVLLAVGLVLAPDALTLRITGLLDGSSTSGLARIISFQQGLGALLDHPIVGVGWGGISELQEGEYRIAREGTLPAAPENYFLYRVVALGVPGGLLYIALAVHFLRKFRRSGPSMSSGGNGGVRWPRTAILACGAAFYVQGMFLPVGSVPNNYFLWLLIGLAESAADAPGPQGRGGES